jgi:hypothetical protein
MTNTQFGWLIAPQLLMLVAIIGGWLKYRLDHWTSKLKYDCTAHVTDLRVRLETLQHGQERLLARIEDLQRGS